MGLPIGGAQAYGLAGHFRLVSAMPVQHLHRRQHLAVGICNRLAVKVAVADVIQHREKPCVRLLAMYRPEEHTSKISPVPKGGLERIVAAEFPFEVVALGFRLHDRRKLEEVSHKYYLLAAKRLVAVPAPRKRA